MQLKLNNHYFKLLFVDLHIQKFLNNNYLICKKKLLLQLIFATKIFITYIVKLSTQIQKY